MINFYTCLETWALAYQQLETHYNDRKYGEASDSVHSNRSYLVFPPEIGRSGNDETVESQRARFREETCFHNSDGSGEDYL
jgi:hypothetical protein